MDWGHYLFSWRGRIDRAKWWLWVLLYVIVAIVLAFVAWATNNSIPAGILQLIFFVLVIVTSLAVTAKRCHDRNRSAWWILVFNLLPGVLAGIGVAAIFASYSCGTVGSEGGLAIGSLFEIAALGVAIWGFVEL